MRTFVLTGWCALAAVLASSCAMKGQGDSTISVRIPSASALRGAAKVGAMSYSWSNACFMVSVKGEGIPVDPPNTCRVSVGRFAGSVAPGSTLNLQVPRGRGLSLDVFVYFRASSTTACPIGKNLDAFDPTNTVRVGQVASFDAQDDVVNLNVEVAMPDSSSNLITQYSLPATCSSASVIPADGSSAIVAGRERQTGGAFVAQSVVSGRQSEKVLTGGSFVMKLTRRPGEE